MNIIHKLERKWKRLRLQPIYVYIFHHVCNSFDAEWMHDCDWQATRDFKDKILLLQQNGIRFISLTEAHNKITRDLARIRKYVVITFDDGYASLREILPWLKEHGIPVTIFVNIDYANGLAFRETYREQYISRQELIELDVEVGMHGKQHLDVSNMSEEEFSAFANKTNEEMSKFNNHIPFWAYTWGRHNDMTDKILSRRNIIPVLTDGEMNYNDASYIHRKELR